MCEISHSTDYISVCVNRYSHCIDSKNNLICFGTKFSVAIYCVQTFKVLRLLNGHKNQVNSVQWIESDVNLLNSSSADKTSIIWDLNDLNDYRIKYQLIGHKESLIVSKSFQLNDNQLLSISSSTDKCIKFWLNDKQINELFVDNFIFDLKICKNKKFFNDIVIITVGANETIDLYQYNEDSHQINHLIDIRGHEDWIRSIDITYKNDSLLIVSSSQDSFIRVHRIKRIDREETDINEKMFSIQTKDSKNIYSVSLETVLSGHEGWVSEVRWFHSSDNCLRLLSVSMDKTMILWQSPNEDDLNGLWIESVRVGEIGGNTLGFLGCTASSQLDMIIGYSFNGALHCWKGSSNGWSPYVVISGHFDEVTDIAWEPKGEYLLSCSNDQTTRLHSIWVKESDGNNTWHELARPQIHGYDIKCISMIDRFSFVSGADEKVIRVLRATKCFASSLKQISNIFLEINNEDVAHSAVVPTLGLSNTAVYEPEKLDHQFRPTILEVPPTEEALLQNTLWPETHKLYGHVFEVFCVATNSCGTVMASASKATKAEHADIILWDIKDSKILAKLSSHQLTVTRIRFSSDDRYIVSASRDRTWALFERQDSNNYRRIAFSDKKNCIHSRIIWDIGFTFDNQYFCSVSRDKSAVFWKIDSDSDRPFDPKSSLGPVSASESPLTLKNSITTVDICDHFFQQNYLIAFGLENGNICFYFWNSITFWTHLLDLNDSHYLTVNRLLFSPKIEKLSDGSIGMNIGSCSADHSVQINHVKIKKLI